MELSLFKKFGRLLFTFLRLALVFSGAEGQIIIFSSTVETDKDDAEVALGNGAEVEHVCCCTPVSFGM